MQLDSLKKKYFEILHAFYVAEDRQNFNKAYRLVEKYFQKTTKQKFQYASPEAAKYQYRKFLNQV